MTWVAVKARIESLIVKIERALLWLEREICEAAAIAWPYLRQSLVWLADRSTLLWAAFVEWLGPAAESVRGRVNADEVQRSLTKAAVSAGAFSLWNLLTDPEVVSVFIVPAALGIGVAILDGLRRRHHGSPPASNPS